MTKVTASDDGTVSVGDKIHGSVREEHHIKKQHSCHHGFVLGKGHFLAYPRFPFFNKNFSENNST
jgi:hypothetical protein